MKAAASSSQLAGGPQSSSTPPPLSTRDPPTKTLWPASHLSAVDGSVESRAGLHLAGIATQTVSHLFFSHSHTPSITAGDPRAEKPAAAGQAPPPASMSGKQPSKRPDAGEKALGKKGVMPAPSPSPSPARPRLPAGPRAPLSHRWARCRGCADRRLQSSGNWRPSRCPKPPPLPQGSRSCVRCPRDPRRHPASPISSPGPSRPGPRRPPPSPGCFSSCSSSISAAGPHRFRRPGGITGKSGGGGGSAVQATGGGGVSQLRRHNKRSEEAEAGQPVSWTSGGGVVTAASVSGARCLQLTD